MPYDIRFEMRPGYLFAEVTGTNCPEVVNAYMQDILERCGDEDRFRLLIHERLDGPRLGTMPVFEIASEGSMKNLGLFDAIAQVDEQMGEMTEFAETVAVNRGMPLRMFNSLEDATRWIAAQGDESDNREIFTGSVDDTLKFRA